MDDQSITRLTSRVHSLVERGERISREDAIAMFELRNLIDIAALARIPRERRHGRDARFFGGNVIDGTLDLPLPESNHPLAIRLRDACGGTLEQWCIRMRDYACDADVGFVVSPRFVAALSDSTDVADLRRTLAKLSSAGAMLVSGEDAEIFDPTLRAALAPEAIPSAIWMDVHKAAHAEQVGSVAAISYGTHDHPEAYVDHLLKLRDMQDQYGGFVAAVVMAIHNPDAVEFFLSAPTAVQTLRITAITRIVLDNIEHIGLPPSLVTLEIATVGLSYGADLLDTTTAIGDVHSSEPDIARRGVDVSNLTVVEAAESEQPTERSVQGVEQRVREARWNAIAVDVAFQPMQIAYETSKRTTQVATIGSPEAVPVQRDEDSQKQA